MGFTRKTIATQINVRFTLGLYPKTVFEFPMRLQLSAEAEAARAATVGLTDEERRAKQHDINVATLADLLISTPLGFDDFPHTASPPTADAKQSSTGDAKHREEADARAATLGGTLKQRATTYFSLDGLTPEEADGMRGIVASALAGYWNAVLPRDYL